MVSGGGVRWAIRTTLLDYVRRSGTLSCAPAGLWSGDSFDFPARALCPDGADVEVLGTGEVLLRAHGGVMNVMLRDPRVVWDAVAGTGALSMDAPPWGRVDIADLRFRGEAERGVVLAASATSAAAAVFGGYYSRGTALDDVLLTGAAADAVRQSMGDDREKRTCLNM